MRLSQQQMAQLTQMHAHLIAGSLQRRPMRLLYDHLNFATLHSLALFACDCKDNPDCTGFVLGIVDIEKGRRTEAMPTRDELSKLSQAILMEIGH